MRAAVNDRWPGRGESEEAAAVKGLGSGPEAIVVEVRVGAKDGSEISDPGQALPEVAAAVYGEQEYEMPRTSGL